MEIRKLTILFFIYFLASCSSLSSSYSDEHAWFSNYALAICLGTAFSDEEIIGDANKAANGYMEISNMPLEAYEELRAALSVWLRKDYLSKHGGQVNIARCIDFSQSKDVEEIFSKYLN